MNGYLHITKIIGFKIISRYVSIALAVSKGGVGFEVERFSNKKSNVKEDSDFGDV